MIKGKVVFILTDVGSKSEGEYPFIELGKGKRAKVYLEGDDPFGNGGMRDYEGKTVVAEGEFNEYGIFIAKSVEIAEEAPQPEPKAPLKRRFSLIIRKIFRRK